MSKNKNMRAYTRVYNRLLCRSLNFDCFEWRNGINSYNRNETVYTVHEAYGAAVLRRLQLFGSVGQKTAASRSVFHKTFTTRKIYIIIILYRT